MVDGDGKYETIRPAGRSSILSSCYVIIVLAPIIYVHHSGDTHKYKFERGGV